MRTSFLVKQIRHIGVILVTAPIVVGAGVALLGIEISKSWDIAQTAIAVNWLSQIFMVSTGIVAAVALTGDLLIELSESTPTSFRVIQFVRTIIVLIASVVGALTMFIPLYIAGVWPKNIGPITAIAPVGAAVFIVSIALTAAAFSGAASTTTISVIAAWIAMALLWDPYVQEVVIQRGVLLITAAFGAVLSWSRLDDVERNIAKVVVG